MDMIKDIKAALGASDLLALKARQRKLDKMTDEATSGKAPETAKPAEPVDNSAFFKAGPKPTAQQKAKSTAQLNKLLNKRDAERAEFAEAWDKEPITRDDEEPGKAE